MNPPLLDILYKTNNDSVLIRKTIISYFDLLSLSSFISLSSLTLSILNTISGDDDSANDPYNYYINKLVFSSSLCNQIQYSLSKDRDYSHFPHQKGNSMDVPRKQLLEIILPRLKSIEVKNYVVMKRSMLLALLDVVGENLEELSISRMNTNACLVFSTLFIPRVGHGLRSLSLGGVGFVSAMPISDNQISQILCFIPNLEQLKLMKLNLLSSHSIRAISNYSSKLERLEVVSCGNMRMDKNSLVQFKLLLDKLNRLTYIDVRYSIECCNGLLRMMCDKAEVKDKGSSLTDDRKKIIPFNLKAFLSSRTIRQSSDKWLGLDNNVWETFKDMFKNADILFIDYIRDESSSRSKVHNFLHNHDDDETYATYDIPLVLNKKTSFAVRQSMNSPSNKLKDALSRKVSTPIKPDYALDKMCLAFEHIGMDTHRKDTFMRVKTPTASSPDIESDDMCFANFSYLKNCYGGR